MAFEPVAEGGMGVVYLALDTELNRQVAFKIVRSARESPAAAESPMKARPPSVDSEEARAFDELKARFLQEAWITGGLEHPGIVPIHELGATEAGIPYYTMRFVRGRRTLADAIDELRGEPWEARLPLLEPFLKLCDTVRYAHSKGVFHRDLKPANVALGEFGETVLLDWGLAKCEGNDDPAGSFLQKRVEELRAASDLRTVGAVIGTPGYMAPEAGGARSGPIDHRADVYSLAAMLFEILTGRLPFVFETLGDHLRQLEAEEPASARSVDPALPGALSDLCARALSSDPRSRPPTVEALAGELRSWQARSAVEKEIERLLHDANLALDSAGDSRGAARLKQVDRAAAALARVASRQADHPVALRIRKRAASLRRQGVQERERANARRLLARVAAIALVILSCAGFLVAAMFDQKRRQTEQAMGEVAIERDATSRMLDRVLRFESDEVRSLIEEEDDLWPIHPDRVADMASWLTRADKALAGRSTHADMARTQEPRSNTAAVLGALLGNLERLERTRADIARRHRRARILGERSSVPLRSAWDDAAARIRSVPQYGGLRLSPQIGLVPLGFDPGSGLFEFALDGTGSLPKRDPETGQLICMDNFALVLVLIPGGACRVGAQRKDAREPNFDPLARNDEWPVRNVMLEPYFLAKFECTCAQWAALAGLPRSGEGGSLPIGGISWEECRRWLPRHNLALPTEEQWEYACRAGTTTPWWSGADSITLRRVGIVADSSGSSRSGGPVPVGSAMANRFGLHDVHGNVAEWCWNRYAPDHPEIRFDSLVPAPTLRVVRGGSWRDGARLARSSSRVPRNAEQPHDLVGVRPARSITRD